MRKLWVLGVTLSILLLGPGPAARAGEAPEPGERFAPARRNGVPNRYIVILEDQWGRAARSSEARGPSVPEVASDVARLHAATPLRTWDLALPGFLVELSEEAARALSRDPRVRLVEQDTYLELQNVTEDCAEEILVTDSGTFPSSPQAIVCDDPAPAGTGCFDNWGLDRIDEGLLAKTPGGLADRDGQYFFNLPGATVHAYILDTGITIGHEEFEDESGNTRIASGVNASVPWSHADRNNVTDNVRHGHGTHTAGILGGKIHGVAKHVQIHPVKIAPGGSFSASDFVEGINWILANRPAGQPAVANLSANGPPSLAGAIAASRLVQSGVTFVQSAGNRNELAANVSMVGPDFPQEIIIAGGMDERDGRWTRSPNDPSYSDYCDPTECTERQRLCDCGSNFGAAVDIWAPASHIVSSGRLANNAICWLSGTSMAAPHVAGTAALLLGRFPNASPSAVEKAIKRIGTVGALTDPQISLSERLLYSRFPATGSPVAGDDRFFTPAGTPVEILFSAFLAGDFDWDGGPLSIVSFGAASSGQRQVLSDRIVYTPAAGFSGVATFSYTVTDGHGNNDTALVRIHVDDQFLPPLAVDDYFVLDPGELTYVNNELLIANDSSRNDSDLRIERDVIRNPANGTLQLSLGSNLRYYTPNPGFTGVDTFVYRLLEEETLLTADATVYLTVGVSLTSTPSPASVNHSTPVNWTATATGLVPSTTRYALFRKKAGTTDWIPALTNPNWQASPNLSWTPAATDIGTWEIIIWVKDGNTPAQMNTYGYATYTNPGPVQVVNGLQVTCPTAPLSATSGVPVEWIVNATGGTSPLRYALFRRRTGTTPWIPDQSSPDWKPNNNPGWTPASTDLGSWDILIWVQDASTPPVLKTCSLGPVQVRAPLTVTSTRSPGSATPATPLSWTATATGGDPATIQYALFRRKVGAASWTPPLTSPAWQADRVLRWTPTTAEAGTWEIVIWVRDAYTPPTMNTYGYAGYYNAGPVQIVTLTSTPSPAAAYHGNAINWTATATGFDPATVQYSISRRRVGTTTWIPSPTVWQASNVLSWTPTSADAGAWEISVGVRDVHTSSTANGPGPAASVNPGQVQVVPPLTVTGTGSPASASPGTALSWNATATGGTGTGRQYALFRRKVGATSWTPPVSSPAWQTDNILRWTPGASEAGTWEIVVWVKDSATPPTMNTHGFAAYYNAGPVQVVTFTSTPSPAAAYHGNAITWTTTATGLDPATVRYAMSRRRVGTADWIPATPAWQTSNVLSWTPGSADVGTWEFALVVKDVHTSPTANGYGYAAYFNPGQVQVVAPLTVTGTGSTPSASPGTALSWTATASGGTGTARRYALFRRKVGATAWTPPVTSPAWQTSNVLSWTPIAADAGTWEIIVWVKDSATTPTMNTYGYAAYYNPGPVQVVTLTSNPSPAGVYHGTAINWTATAIGFDPATVRYAMRRRRVGTADWIPAAPAWQASNVLSWIPGSADIGTWEISLSARDAHTSSTGNGSGPAASFNPGQAQVAAPPTVTGTGSTPSASPGTALSWTATANGGTGTGRQYALFRKKVGATAWTPPVTSPIWQTSNVLGWTPSAAEAGTWEIIVWMKDNATPPAMNTYGYASYYNPGPVQVVTLTSNPSPAGVYHGTAINWTATATGFDPATVQYAIRRRRVGTTAWTPATPAWQAGNVLSWTPGSADIGTWEISLSARDVHTSSTGNGSGPAISFNPGQVQVTAPLTVTGTGSPSSSPYGTTITWTAYANGGHPPTIRYALFRRLAGTSSWIPAVTSPTWQTSNTLSWTPTASDVGLWEIIIWVKDGNTPPNMNTYGYAAYYNAGPVEVTAPVYQWYAPIGWVDGYDRQHIWGWACDPDYPTESNRVDIWSTSWQFLGSAGAYYSSASPINSACGGGWAHYFDFYHYGSIPPGTHFMVWSIDLPYATPGNDNRPLGGSGSIGDGTVFVMP